MSVNPRIHSHKGMLVFEDQDLVYHVSYLTKRNGVWYDPDGDIYDISDAAAAKHNSLVSAAEIAGLADCAVGLGRTFYRRGHWVYTFTKQPVARARVYRDGWRFSKHGFTFYGVEDTASNAIFFVRTA